MDEPFLAAAAAALESLTGLRSPEANRAHFRRVLLKHAVSVGLSPERYAESLAGDETALRHLVNAVTIGETYFFREAAQFKLLRDHIVPRLRRPATILRCWSASCSTGEEAVSMAALLDECLASQDGAGFEVHATDINDEALGRLRSGVFPPSSLRRDGEELHSSLERHIVGRDRQSLTIGPSLLSSILVRRLNLYRDPLDEIPEGLDFIFLRNTLLYMSQEKRETIVDRVASKLREGGILFLATSEIPFIHRDGLRLEERDRVYFLVREPKRPGPAVADGPVPGVSIRHVMGSGVEPQGTRDTAGSFDIALARYEEGRLQEAAGDTLSAAEEFRLALEADSLFWPARFRGACLEAAHSRRRARREFEGCMTDIDGMDAVHRERLAAVLDDFNSAYFRRMCERWIERLDGTGGRKCR